MFELTVNMFSSNDSLLPACSSDICREILRAESAFNFLLFAPMVFCRACYLIVSVTYETLCLLHLIPIYH